MVTIKRLLCFIAILSILLTACSQEKEPVISKPNANDPNTIATSQFLYELQAEFPEYRIGELFLEDGLLTVIIEEFHDGDDAIPEFKNKIVGQRFHFNDGHMAWGGLRVGRDSEWQKVPREELQFNEVAPGLLNGFKEAWLEEGKKPEKSNNSFLIIFLIGAIILAAVIYLTRKSFKVHLVQDAEIVNNPREPTSRRSLPDIVREEPVVVRNIPQRLIEPAGHGFGIATPTRRTFKEPVIEVPYNEQVEYLPERLPEFGLEEPVDDPRTEEEIKRAKIEDYSKAVSTDIYRSDITGVEHNE